LESFYTKGFDNQKFWENRYETNPELGSGIGSRGSAAEYKSSLISWSLNQFHPESILDIGCGDLECIKNLNLTKYTGVDIARNIIPKNKKLFPQWNFICGNFLEIVKQMEIRADLVLCLDVLIHQHKYEEYISFVNAIIDSAKKIGIITAYEECPGPNNREIIAYHEPITKTLSNLNISKFKIIRKIKQKAFCYFLK